MSPKRRKFSQQFKAEVVAFVIQTGRPMTEIARELNIHEGILGNRVKLWKNENPVAVKRL
jgi:transposase-like protein